ncbi:MAG: GNAT family N-acetyltransferase, partial [Bryobacteraceae bacterium]
LTRSTFRRRGIARRLMEQALEFTRERGVHVARLDATAVGRPLYASLGFEDECAVERWTRGPSGLLGIGRPAAAYRPMPDLDRNAFGCARVRLLESLADEESACVPELGYAMGRPGARAAYFGPCVARTAEAARKLVEWFLARHVDEALFWDLLPENRAAAALAAELGFVRERALVRMIRRETLQVVSPAIHAGLTFAIAGFEYG